MTIRYKLLAAFGIVCLLSAGAVSYSTFNLATLSSLITRLYDGPLMAISYARSAQVNFAKARRDVEMAMTVREPLAAGQLAAVEKSMEDFRSDMAVVRERMPKNASFDETYNATVASAAAWFEAARKIINPPATGVQELPVPQLVNEQGNKVSAHLDVLAESAAAYGFEFRSIADTEVGATQMKLMIAAGLTVLIGLLLALGSAYSLAQPLRTLTARMKDLADGNFDVVLPGVGRNDEVGQIAAAVETFKIKSKERADAETERQLAEVSERQRQAAAEQERREREREVIESERRAAAERAHQDQLKVEAERRNAAERQAQAAAEQSRAIEVLAAGLERLSTGDLTAELSSEMSEGYRKVRDDFNRTVEQLRETISAIVAATREITSASAEIASSTTDLSQRTEEQAAAIEETSASMEEIATTVRHNADNAQTANESAVATQAIAEKGGAVVDEAVKAMALIEESSHKIGDIIGVIDEIARQTNLLALNAAVEAARAGDAGRGFAVVASEVRSLAQRSAQAAKDIKNLITTSNGLVKNGVDLVNRTGSSLGEIVESIKKVASIVGEIATASREQATGIDQVNKALTSMDEVTQQNSALVEENAATAKVLEQQARAVDERMALFRLAQEVEKAAAEVKEARAA
ncbi:MAG: methyl-accepting chemotaxis protein [Pseudolabrys sp.]